MQHIEAKTQDSSLEVLSIILQCLLESLRRLNGLTLAAPGKGGKEEGRSGERISTGRRGR